MRFPRLALFGLLTLLASAPARAAYPVVATATVAGSGGGLDAAHAMARDAVGNVYVAGSLTQAGMDDIWIAKYSPALVLLSSYTYDKAGFPDMAFGVAVDTTSGGVFAAGFVSSSNTYPARDIWLAKFDSNLVQQATVTVNGAGNDWDEAKGLRAANGELYVVGHSSAAGGKAQWVARYDTGLVLLSSATFIQFDAYGIDILPMSSGNIFVAGSRAINAATSVDAWIGKYSSALVLLASATVAGSAGNNDQYHRLVDDGGGGVFAVGYLNTATAADRYIAHYDSNLVRLSSSLVNGPGNSNEYYTDAFMTAGGTLLIAGDHSEAAGAGGINALIAEYSTGLALLSSTSYRSSGSGTDHAAAILMGTNQDLYAAGWVTEANQDAWVARLSTTPAPDAFPGCATTNNVGSGQTYATIQSAVNALPTTLTGHSCVVIRDGATYAEQVTVLGFTNNGSLISIFADPGSGLRPAVSPPAASTAAFRINNTSVTLAGIDVWGTNVIPYGVQASSAYVTISSMNIYSNSKIFVAGVSLSSDSSLSYSSITVQNAYGLRVDGSNNFVSNSTMTSISANYSALILSGASSNTITSSFLLNTAGRGFEILNRAANNLVSFSTVTSNLTGSVALYINNSSSNTVSGTHITNSVGYALWVINYSSANTISQSTMSTPAAYYALFFSSSSGNTVVNSWMNAPAGTALRLEYANNNSVSFSTVTGNSVSSALYAYASSSNTVTQSYISNPLGYGAHLLSSSNYNTISQSMMVGNGSGSAALVLDTSASNNTISQSYISNSAGMAASLSNNANYNTITQSTVTISGLSGWAIWINGGAYNTISQNYISNPSGHGLLVSTNYNTISQSTITSNSASFYALNINGSTNTVSQCYISNPAGTGAFLAGAQYNIISQSTMTSNAAGYYGLQLSGSPNTTITQSYISNPAGTAANLYASYNTVSQSVFTSNAASYYALTLDIAYFNTITQSHITNPAGYGASLSSSNFNTIDQSTITSNAAASLALWINVSSSNTVQNSYIQGSTATLVTGSTGTAINSSMLVASGSFGDGLALRGGGVNLTVASSTLRGGASGRGLLLDLGSKGLVSIGSVTVTGAARGLAISTQSTGFILAVDSITFRDLAAGATAIDFLGGTFVATITAASFDASVAVNVNGSPLDTASRITMNGHSGARTGPAYERDPNSLVDWQANAPPTPPSAFAGTAVSTASILWSWTDNSTDEAGFRIKLGGVNLSGDLAVNATSWLQTGLSANTTSGDLLVQAFNSAGTADSGAAARYSLAEVPTGLASSGVFQTSATVSWTAANPAGTVFELERSTGFGFALVSASSQAVAYTDTALAAAATYYYRVRALNGDAVATVYASSITFLTAQMPGALAPSAFAGAAQSTSSILWSWTDNSPNETGYRVLTGTISLSGDLAANATTWLQAGLTANTAYGPYAAQAFNAGGTAESATASRTTLADAPTGLAAAGVYQTSGTLSWNAGANPAGTTFALERSTGTGYGLQFTGSATTYFEQYLTPGATHYFRVRAFNGEAVATAYASSIAVVALPAPPVPGAAGTPVGAALGTSSATWTWVLASGATNHFLFRPSDNSYLGSSSSGPFVQTALSPNTAYGLRAAGVNLGGIGPLSPSGTAYTLAAVPAGGAVSAAASTSVFVSWGLNGNPASTVAQLERSTNAVSYTALASGAITAYADADLIGCTTYYYRVRNLNGDGFATLYSSFSGVTANTLPGPPPGLTASANAGGTVSLGWNLSPTEGVTGYRLYWDSGSGAVNYGATIAVLTSTETAFTTGVLASSASYTFALRAAHRCGLVETTGALAMSGAAVAPPPVRAAIKEPDSGRRINGNRITILGELISGTPSDVQQVLFQYKLATSTAWLDVGEANLNHENPDFDFPYFVHVDVTVLAAGSYDLRAVAYDRSGVPDSAPPAVRVVVDPVTPDISETVTGDGKIKKDQTVSNAVTSTIETAGAGASDPAVRVSLPPGVVTAATATLSVIANPTITTAAPSGQTFVGSSIKIDLSNGQSALNGTAAITLTYPDTVRFPSLLQIYYLNEATGQWSRDFATAVDTASRTVTGLTPHFSTFALMLGTAFAADLNSVQVYPVPFKPNGPNADEGRPFTAGNANSGIIFANLAMGAEIKIYTMTGRLVSSIGNPSIAGIVRWDARNQDGRDVASGAYFAVITAGGHKAVVKKLVIIR